MKISKLVQHILNGLICATVLSGATAWCEPTLSAQYICTPKKAFNGIDEIIVLGNSVMYVKHDEENKVITQSFKVEKSVFWFKKGMPRRGYMYMENSDHEADLVIDVQRPSKAVLAVYVKKIPTGVGLDCSNHMSKYLSYRSLRVEPNVAETVQSSPYISVTAPFATQRAE